MLLSGRKLRPDNNACQGVAPWIPLRISPALRFARLFEMLRSSFDHGPVPSGLSCHSSLFICLTRLRLVLGRRCTPPTPLLCALCLPSARPMKEHAHATPCR